MKTRRPGPWELIAGLLLIGASIAAGWHLVTHPGAHALYSWLFVVGMALSGMWMMAPVRTEILWTELSNSLPFLQSSSDEGEN